jgi:hypothetical protein
MCQGNLSLAFLGTRAIASKVLLYTQPVYTLLLPDKQTGEAWEPSKNRVPSEMGERWVAKCCKVLQLLYSLKKGVSSLIKKMVISS